MSWHQLWSCATQFIQVFYVVISKINWGFVFGYSSEYHSKFSKIPLFLCNGLSDFSCVWSCPLVPIKGNLDDTFKTLLCVAAVWVRSLSSFNMMAPLCTKQAPQRMVFQVWYARLYWQTLTSLSSNTFKMNWNNKVWKSRALSPSITNSCGWMGANPYSQLPRFCGKPSQIYTVYHTSIVLNEI